MVYPLKMRPYYRHAGMTPWGGRALGDLFGKDIPDDRTGESLEVSAIPGMESVIDNGALAGGTLADAFIHWGEQLTGAPCDAFPLLVKLLDARETLSVQVHPGDAYARANEGKLGKTEAWVVLGAPRGAKLVYGIEPDTDLRSAVADGAIERALNWIDVAPGDVLYIPHGLVHALGDGIVVYEIQQASDVTYRFWDWGRVDAAGKPRALHIERALDVTRPALRPGKCPGATVLCAGGSYTNYICDGNFELMRLNVAGVMPLCPGRMQLLTAMTGAQVATAQGAVSLMPGETAVVPAACTDVRVIAHGPILRAGLPDRAKRVAELGYRAELVAGLEGDV